MKEKMGKNYFNSSKEEAARTVTMALDSFYYSSLYIYSSADSGVLVKGQTDRPVQCNGESRNKMIKYMGA